ncbi:hypothetical protein JCM8097_008819 [Rhodosporidiobolus ruineniae]
MSALPPSAVDASTRLLRVLASVAAQLDPVKGIKATTLKALAEDVEDIRKEHGESLSSDIRQLLSTAVATFISSSTPAVPYSNCHPAYTALSQALPLLLLPPRPPSPPRPSPFLSLPAELVAHVVGFCQTDDLRLRQNTNLALSRTCRLFHRVVSPILAVEMHLFTAGQVEGAYEKVKTMSSLTTLTIDVSLDDVERKSSDRWAGRCIPPLIDHAARLGAGVVHLHIRAPPSLDLHAPANNAVAYANAVQQALGIGGSGWAPPIRMVTDLCLPDVRGITTSNLPYRPSTAFKRLRLGTTSPPSHSRADHAHRALQASRIGQDAGESPKSYAYEVLALPHRLFYPEDALPLLLPPVLPAPTLTHLEIAFQLADVDRDCRTVARILRDLAPSLRHLAVRIQRQDAEWEDKEEVQDTVFPALRFCTKLEHLEVGGNVVTFDYFLAAKSLPHLRTLVALPSDDPNTTDLISYASKLPPSLRTLVVYVQDLSSTSSMSTFNNRVLSELMTACEGRPWSLVLKEDVAEEAWLENE